MDKTTGLDLATSGQVTSVEEAASAGSEAASSKATSLSNEDLAKMYQPKTRPSLAQRLKSNEFLFTSPNRYVFPGAEVFDRDDESDISSNHSGSDTDSDDEAGDSSDDNVEKKNPSNNDNVAGSDHKNSENHHSDSNPTPDTENEENPNLATTFNTKTISEEPA